MNPRSPTVEDRPTKRAKDGWTAARLLDAPASDLARAASACTAEEAIVLAAAMREEASRHYLSDAQRARRIARRAIEWGHAVDHPTAVAWGLRTQAEANVVSGRIRDAADAYARAARALARGGDSQLLGQLLVGRLHVLSLLGRHAEADRTAARARRLLEQVGDRTYLAKLAMNRGNTFFQRDRHTNALAEWDRAAALFRDLGQRDEVVLGLETNRAVALTQLDRHDEAVALFRELENECAARRSELLLAQVRMNAAYVHSLRGEFDLALRLLGDATAYFRSTNHPAFLAASLLNRGEVYHLLNLHRESAALAEEAAPSFHAEGMRYDEALALAQAAFANLSLGEVTPAQRSVRRARRLFQREANESRVALMELLAAAVSDRLGRKRAAIDGAKVATTTFRRLGLVRWEAWGEVLQSRLDPSARRRSRLERLLRRIPRQIYPVSRYQVLAALGSAFEHERDSTAAARAYRRAIEQVESIRARIPTEDSKIAFTGDTAGLYDRMIALESSRPGAGSDSRIAARLFDWMERERAQSLWDRMCEPEGRAEELSEDALRLRRHVNWLHARASRLELGSSRERAHAAKLRRSLVAAESRWDRMLRDSDEKRVRGEAGRRQDQLTIEPLSALGRTLPAGWGLVSYHLGANAAAVVVVVDGATHAVRLREGASDQVAHLADRLEFQWGAAAMLRASGRMHGIGLLLRTSEELLRELDQILWEPLVEAGLPSARDWIVSPHGPAHRIPFHALLGPRGYRVDDSVFAVTPSARVWSALPAPRGDRSAWIGGVASDLLPHVADEVGRVARHLSSWRTVTCLEPRRGQWSTDLPQGPALLHLAAHGSLRPDNPNYSYLELADGPLFVHDLAAMRLPGATAVLTACSSGRGVAPSGDEWLGLSRGFLRAGASTVVASLWPIDDEPTAELIDRFYEGFVRGEAAAPALARAMRATRERWPHPWQWASFGCLGGVPERGSRELAPTPKVPG